ncbi:MAG: Gfo/Idh/MocA family oxidoreductase [Alphaproteobacteria bacterium]|nr:Gfo/Idh/MocA family oxidoreductase [Alphaproteobacteria bacterium]
MTLAVLGLGSIGTRHATNALALGEAVVGFDPDPARRGLLAEKGGRPAESRAAALDGADAAIVASPNAHHLDDICAALGAGCHVMVEKPMAHATDGVQALLDAARAGERVVFAAHNLRFHPAVRAAKAILDSSRLGTPLWARALAASYLPGWRPRQDYRAGFAADARTGGAVFDFIHEFDLLAHLLGPYTAEAAVARRSGILDIAAEDCADAILRHETGPVSTLHIDYVTRPAVRITEVAGTEGMLRIDIPARRLVHLAVGGETLAEESFGGEHGDDYVTEMRAFLDCVRGEATPACDGQEALAVLAQVIRVRRLAGLPAGG